MNVLIPTDHDVNILAEVLLPISPDLKQIVIINSAGGVPKEFYRHFATHLCKRGFIVITYDYHLFHVPKEQRRKWRKELIDLGKTDFESILLWANNRYPTHSLHVIGHGIGGNIIGFAPSSDKIESIVTIGSGIPGIMQLLQRGIFFKTMLYRVSWSMQYSMTKRVALNNLENTSLAEFEKHATFYRLSLVQMPRSIAFNAPFIPVIKARLLTLSISDDVVTFDERDEPLRKCNNLAKSQIRHVQGGELSNHFIGFFGLFVPRKENFQWHMVSDWIAEDTDFEETLFAEYDDTEFPLVKIRITMSDPSREAIEKHLMKMKEFLLRGPVCFIIDLTMVNWADDKMLKIFDRWMQENGDLVRTKHRMTVYIAPNFFIRNFIIMLHALPFSSLVRPVHVFKTSAAAYNFAIRKFKRNPAVPAH